MSARSPILVFAGGLAAFAVLGGAAAPVFDEGQKKTLAAHRTATPPKIDGKLDDPAWAEATPDDRLLQRYPHDGVEPTQRTVVRVLYDDDAVYVGLRMEDRDPDRIVARLARRDRQIESDLIGIAFDSRHDHATAYAFFLNAAGVQTDALLYDDTEITYDWDAVWDGATSRDAGGWSAEFRIPLSVLRFSDLPVQAWGFQVERYISRVQEKDRWSYTPQSISAEVSPMGHLVGLVGLHPRPTLELRPFAVARLRAHTDSGGAFLGYDPDARVDPQTSVGLDAKIGLTSNLVVDATVNPDFGQVDADQVVLNLSHFETFFPEKRPFFLEGTDLFQTPLGIFYSRRIGRSSVTADSFTIDGTDLVAVDRPTAVPIRAAAKLTGKLGGKLSVGALEALTGPDEVDAIDVGRVARTVRLLPPMSYAVARAKYSFRGASFLGAMATGVTRFGEARDAALDHDAYTQSVDGGYRSEDTRWRFSGQAVASERVGGARYHDDDGYRCDAPGPSCRPITRNDGQKLGPGDVGYGGQISAGHEGEHWYSDATVQELSPALDLDDMGFKPRYDRHVLDLSGGYRELTPGTIFQRWDVDLWTHGVLSWDGVPEDAAFGVNLNGTLRSFWSFHLEGTGRVFPGTWDHYETQDGAWFEQPPTLGWGASVTSDSRRAVAFEAGAWGGAAIAGHGGYDVNAEATVRLNVISTLELEIMPQLSWSGGHMRNWFSDPCRDDQGNVCTPDSTARHYVFGELEAGSLSVTGRLAYTFSPKLSLQGYAQLFLDRGRWSRYSRVDTVGRAPRFGYADLRPDPTLAGDSDGDGVKDDDFQDLSLNLNVVLRWEYAPGATLLGVYTRAQSSALVLAGDSPRLSLRGLTTGPTDDVLLVKLTYFIGP